MTDANIPTTGQQAAMFDAVKQYFLRGDAGQMDVVDLFTDDVQIFFPKFGITHGKHGFAELAQGLMSALSAIAHDIGNFDYTIAGDTVVVEGTTFGTDRVGHAWRGGETPGGRFCSVFKFRDGLIARMHIYLDPDYTSRDADRFLWGTRRTW